MSNFPLFFGELMVHIPTGKIGRVNSTFWPDSRMLSEIRLELQLADGKREEFPLTTLRQASDEEAGRFDVADIVQVNEDGSETILPPVPDVKGKI